MQLPMAQNWLRKMDKEEIVIVNLSGRGDKDIPTLAKIDGISIA